MNRIQTERCNEGKGIEGARFQFLGCAGAWISARLGLILSVGLVLCVAMGSGCSKQGTAPNVLAKVGGREITIEDFEQEVQWRVRQGQPLPGKQELLDDLINRELSQQKARAAGLEKTFEVRRSHENTLITALQQHELMPRLESVAVSPEELRAAYQKDISRYTRPGKARLALIYVKASEKVSEEKLKELSSRIAEARQHARALPDLNHGFGQVALNFSEDQASRYRGGDVGWFDDGQPAYSWPKEVVTGGLRLKPGEMSEVIRAADGFYLVAKTDIREPSTIPFEEVQGPLERKILAEKRQQTEADFTRELHRLAAVQTHPQALSRAAYPTTAVAKAEAIAPPALPRSQ